MVRMRGAAAVLLAVIMMVTAVPFVLSDGYSDADRAVDGVLIYELQPTKENDGFALKNYGSTPVDIGGYYVIDGTGTTKGYTLPSVTVDPGNVVAFVQKTTGGDYFSTETAGREVRLESGYKTNLNNDGDAFYLYSSEGGTLLDAVCYAKGSATAGWSGKSVDLGFKEDIIRRCEPTDSDTYFDWVAVGDGYTGFSFAGTSHITGTTVDAFTFPESGGTPILKTLMSAESSIKVSIYMITSKYVTSILKERAAAGVDVRIILEGKPLGYPQSDYVDIIKPIVDAGGEVKYIGATDTYDRYSYVHNKYAIVDGKDVIITSENWTVGNISTDKANRGWGAVVHSTAFAAEMDRFFTSDWDLDKDFKTLSELYPSAQSESLPSKSTVQKYIDSVSYTPKTVENVTASIYMSPDNTFKALQYLIGNAKTRVYTEQMDLGASYGDLSTLSPLSAMKDAAERGVDAKFMITYSDNKELIRNLNSNTKIQARGMTPSGYATMHNKGVIIDDAVWVSSVNWTDNAFMNNRECGLYLESKELADFYAESYLSDWQKNINNTGEDGFPVKEVVTYGSIAAIILVILLVVWKLFLKDAKKKAKKEIKKQTKKKGKKK